MQRNENPAFLYEFTVLGQKINLTFNINNCITVETVITLFLNKL